MLVGGFDVGGRIDGGGGLGVGGGIDGRGWLGCWRWMSLMLEVDELHDGGGRVGWWLRIMCVSRVLVVYHSYITARPRQCWAVCGLE